MSVYAISPELDSQGRLAHLASILEADKKQYAAAGVTVGPSNVPIVVSLAGKRVSCRTDADHCVKLP